MTNFKVGQKVVCVKVGKKSKLILGNQYTIQGLNSCPKCNKTGINVGISTSYLLHNIITCDCGYSAPFEFIYHTSDKFRPLTYAYSTSEILAKFPLTEEKADVEIKEHELVK